jgi:hypothetical protein
MSYLTSQQRSEAPAPPQPEGLRGFWLGALLLIGQRPQRIFSLLAIASRSKLGQNLAVPEPPCPLLPLNPLGRRCPRRVC